MIQEVHSMLILFPIAMLVFFFIYLYEKGLIAFQTKTAILFSASLNADRAKFSRCTGRLTRILRFKSAEPVKITFKKELSSGKCAFYILCGKEILLESNDDTEEYLFTPVSGKRSKLKIALKSATGSYSLSIKKAS